MDAVCLGSRILTAHLFSNTPFRHFLSVVLVSFHVIFHEFSPVLPSQPVHCKEHAMKMLMDALQRDFGSYAAT